MAHPLRFDEDGGRVDLSMNIKNVGRSVAFGILIDSKIVADLSDKTFAQVQHDICEPMRNRPWNSSGPMLFPGKQLITTQAATITPQEIKGAFKSADGGIMMMVFVCIDYKFSFAEERHQTRYAFNLGIPNPNGTWKGFFVPEGTPQGVELLPHHWVSSAD
jgi:hypothetical protein